MRFIGDIHGDVLGYMALIDGTDKSVQVGDFGIGFIRNNEIVDDIHRSGKHRFIRGNHDDPGLCKERIGYIPDGTQEGNVFYVGGAWSIDYAYRTPGYTWWPEEELSLEELDTVTEAYAKAKPDIMVTHDCPTSVAYSLFIGPTGKRQYVTRTAEALDRMLSLHRPKVWLFGHWHENKDVVQDGTRFVCLGINAYIDLEV